MGRKDRNNVPRPPIENHRRALGKREVYKKQERTTITNKAQTRKMKRATQKSALMDVLMILVILAFVCASLFLLSALMNNKDNHGEISDVDKAISSRLDEL